MGCEKSAGHIWDDYSGKFNKRLVYDCGGKLEKPAYRFYHDELKLIAE